MTVNVKMTNGGSDSVNFVNDAGTTLAQVKGYDDGSSNGHLEFYTNTSGTVSEKVRVQNGLHIQQDSSSNNRIVFRGQPSSSYRWNIDNYGSSNQMRFFREDDSNAANGAVMMTIDSSGNLLVGTATAKGILTVKESANNDYSKSFAIVRSDTSDVWNLLITNTNDLYFGLNNGNKAYINNSTGAWTAVSDMRLKKDISEINYGLSEIMKLAPVSYLMADEEDTAKKHLGFIAQDVQQVIPESVGEMFDGMLSLDKTEIVAVLVKAIQEQQTIINTLTERITALENKQ